jgi:hypothetical protein
VASCKASTASIGGPFDSLDATKPQLGGLEMQSISPAAFASAVGGALGGGLSDEVLIQE